MRKKKVRRCPACDKLHMHLDRDMCSKCYNLLYVIPLAHEAQQKVRETRPNRKLGLSPYNIKLNIRNKDHAEQ